MSEKLTPEENAADEEINEQEYDEYMNRQNEQSQHPIIWYRCPYCGMGFRVKAEMISHLERNH
jgi:rubrerythrin